jgi:hypothetical protein
MSYDLKLKNISYPKDYNVNYSCGKKAIFTKNLFDNLYEKLNNINTSLIYVIYLPMIDGNFIKIGFANSVDDFLKRKGRFDTHTKSFNCYKPPILLKIFSIQEKEIELKLHRYLKEKKDTLHRKVQFINLKDSSTSLSNETYLFDKDLFKDLGNIIQSITIELNPKSINAKINSGYISDNGFISNKIIYDNKRKLENTYEKENIDKENKKYKFNPYDEKDITNLEKYSGYESDDGFIVDDDNNEDDDYSSSDSDA